MLYYTMHKKPSDPLHAACFSAARAAAIAARIRVLAARAARRWQHVSGWSGEALARLAAFACRGKLVRGQLVLLGAELGGMRPSRALYECAAALELFHSSILVHDDIIDQDAVRRGAPTMHAQYAAALRARGEHGSSAHRGAALAICAGDCGFFLTFAILGALSVPAPVRHALLQLWADAFAHVSLAEMDDVHLAPGAAPAPREAIWRVYRYKTARYTFCLPLATGLIMAGAPPALRRRVHTYGDQLGLLFQLKDDELGLFGSARQTGKPVGSDIAQNKKTLYHHYLLTGTRGATQRRLRAIFGAARVNARDVAAVRAAVEQQGIRAALEHTAHTLAARARRSAARMPVADALRAQLLQLVDYSMARTR